MRLLRYLLPALLLLTTLAWWATRGGDAPAAQAAAVCCDPAPYPADMEERLGRVQGMVLAVRAADNVPSGLAWQDGAGQPELGDPAARKGGVLRVCNVGPYPANWLAFGSPAPQFFHYNLFTTVELPLAARHPQTGAAIPGTACQWAVQGDKLYFRLNPAARYSNGRPLRAGDYVLGALLRAECGDAGFEQLCAAASGLEARGEELLVLTLRRPLSVAAAAALLHAAEPAFYAEFGSDYRTRYADRVPPTTGGYTLGRAARGRMAELVRVRDWWARGLPYYRYSCNVDSIEHHFLTDEAQAWEFVLRGRLDLLQTRNVSLWQQRLPELEAAGLQTSVFKAEYPMPPYGVALNAEALPSVELRRGLLHAMDMDAAVALLFCGEGERLTTFHSGYGALPPRETPQHAYDPEAARSAFAAAGYTQAGEDGILRNAAGERLSVRFTYTPNDKTSTLAAVLAQSARRCGAELVPEPVPWQQAARQQEEGRYQLLFWATVAPAEPNPARFFGSRAAGYDAPFRLHDAETDALIEAYERTGEAAALAALDRRVAELAVWLPGWQENRIYAAHAPRVRFPRGFVPALYELTETHLYWIAP